MRHTVNTETLPTLINTESMLPDTIQQKPKKPRFVPNVLYMMITSFRVDWRKVSHYVRSNPSETFILDNSGCTLLHYACSRYRGCSTVFADYLEALKALADVNPDATSARNRAGRTPLCMAAFAAASMECSMLNETESLSSLVEVFKLLLRYNPDAAWIADEDGTLPIDALWQSYTRRLGTELYEEVLISWIVSSHQKYEDCDQGDANTMEGRDMETVSSSNRQVETRKSTAATRLAERFWNKMNLLLCAMHHGTIAIVDHKNDTPLSNDNETNNENKKWRAVHAAVSVPCPLPVIEIAMKLFPQDIMEKDEEGRLPLANAAMASKQPLHHSFSNDVTGESQSCVCGAQPSDKHALRKQQSIIELLCQANPKAAEVQDRQGRLPLSHAIISGKEWSRELKPISCCAPDAFYTRDFKTRLYPFMLAGASEDASMNTVYQLLCSSPDILKHCLPEDKYDGGAVATAVC